jgi:radical SAM enzyme (TIGR01210 family)
MQHQESHCHVGSGAPEPLARFGKPLRGESARALTRWPQAHASDLPDDVTAIAYPSTSAARDRWILARRPARVAVDPKRPHAWFVEEERTESGAMASVATVILTGRECPWRCLMCDLWRFNLAGPSPPGAILAQVDRAVCELGQASRIKLYNGGSFFDPRAVPVAERAAIGDRLRGFDRVIVECHPVLVSRSCAAFAGRLGGGLEIAIGLETAHPEVLERLNKRMTLGLFRRAAEFLVTHRIALRAFVLVKPPFMTEAEALEWGCRSIDFAFDCGASVVSLIPVRGGNGALEVLAALGQFAPPRLETLESVLDYGVGRGRGRVFADLWDLERFASCPACFGPRRQRLHSINASQAAAPPVVCAACGAGAGRVVQAPRTKVDGPGGLK